MYITNIGALPTQNMPYNAGDTLERVNKRKNKSPVEHMLAYMSTVGMIVAFYDIAVSKHIQAGITVVPF